MARVFPKALWTMSFLFLAGGIAALAWGIAGRLATQLPPARLEAMLPPLPPPPPFPDLSQFAHIGRGDYRLARPAPAQQPEMTLSTPVMPLRVRLIGTALEKGRPCAIFTDEMQRPVVKTIDQQVDGCRILSIERRKVVIEQQSRRVELTVPESYSGDPQ